LVASPSKAFRIAAIDIGTNSVLLTIAEQHDGGVRILVDRATVTRLGERVDGTRRLSKDAIERTLRCLEGYAKDLAQHQVAQLDVVGTSALRDAQASSDFLDCAEGLLGTRPRVIDGNEEARLTSLGALSGLSFTGPFVVVDIGGGSTELIVGSFDGTSLDLEHFISLDIGSVRLTERRITHDPPTPTELAALTSDVEIALQEVPFDLSKGTLIGVAGTVTTLCAIDLGLSPYDAKRVHGTTLELSSIEAHLSALSRIDRQQRSQIRGLEPSRADVIIAGAIIIERVLRLSGRNSLRVSDRGVRYGLLSNLFAKSQTSKQG
jgi:exopolyphosphatase/guanosine-5'-triphosphate,3'-diphosphate pyrophosphatase